MIKIKENVFEKIVPFIVMFIIWELVILFGTFIIFKLSILVVSDISLLSFLVDHLRETIKEYNFIDFIIANKPYCILASFFSLILAFGTLE